MMGFRTNWSRGLSASYPAEPGTVALTRRLVGDLAVRAGAGADQVEAIRLAVSEAVTNAILHAYRDREPGEIHLTAMASDGSITVQIADDGNGLTAGGVSSGLGWGWKLIADACDALTIAQPPTGGVDVQMRFDIGAAESPQDGHGERLLASAAIVASARPHLAAAVSA